jgi:hypothetical protein
MNKKQTINWLVGTVLVGVLMVGLSTTVSASLLDNRYHISGYVGSNKTNDSDVFIQKDSYGIDGTSHDFTNLAQYGLDVGVRIGDTPWVVSAGYFYIDHTHKHKIDSFSSDSERYYKFKDYRKFIQHRLGGRWIHNYSDRLSVYLGLGLANHNISMATKRSYTEDSYNTANLSQLGLYSEIAGIVSITDRLYTGVRLDYSFANYASESYKLSAISYGVVAGVSF